MNDIAAVAWNVAASGLPRKDVQRCALCSVVLWAESEKAKKVCVLCEDEEG